jgi:hypothetical protein
MSCSETVLEDDSAMKPDIEEILIMLPVLLNHDLPTALQHRKTPVKFVPMTRFHSSNSKSSARIQPETPALFTEYQSLELGASSLNHFLDITGF